jgi:hypothetical protein
VFYRFAAFAALTIASLLAQTTDVPTQGGTPEIGTSDAISDLQPDVTDPNVIRAKTDLERVRLLIAQGALPAMRLRSAEEDYQNALDMSVLKANLFGKDLLPEQADQMVVIAQRIVLRKQKSMIEMQQLVASGVISRAEASASGADFDRAQTELHLAETRAKLVQQMAESLRVQKAIAAFETQAESRPDWAGKVYTRYDGNGYFNRSDLGRIEVAYTARFSKPLPISADGETPLHRSLGFDHRGRVDVAVSPDQPEGMWLMRFLENSKIPYFAFRTAVPGKATGAHIHIGTSSTRLVSAD